MHALLPLKRAKENDKSEDQIGKKLESEFSNCVRLLGTLLRVLLFLPKAMCRNEWLILF